MPKNLQYFAPEALGKAIAKHRVEIGLTQDTVAEKLGIGVEAVSRIERGVAMPTITRLAQFADLYNCQLVDFLAAASKRNCDQASYLAKLMEPLDSTDRVLIVDLIERLVRHLIKDGHKSPDNGSKLNGNLM